MSFSKDIARNRQDWEQLLEDYKKWPECDELHERMWHHIGDSAILTGHLLQKFVEIKLLFEGMEEEMEKCLEIDRQDAETAKRLGLDS